jgi:hypothetical protein
MFVSALSNDIFGIFQAERILDTVTMFCVDNMADLKFYHIFNSLNFNIPRSDLK